jgi:hypothetical protein
MNLGRGSPVEPLSRPAWERVEAGLFARLDRGEHSRVPMPEPAPRVPVPIWASAMTFAAAAAFLLWWSFKPPAAMTEEVVARTDEPAEVAQVVPPAARSSTHIVTTGAPTRTTIGEATLTLAAESDVHVSGSDADGWLVRIEAGEVDCEVAPRRGRPAFVVQAGETQVTVVGTRFTVTREGFGAHVAVREGQVRVMSGATQLSLGPGEEWPVIPLVSVPRDDADIDAPVPVRKKGRTPQHALDVAGRFERAARLEAEDPRAALKIYRSLAGGKGRWAANALYAQGRLELELGRRKAARAVLQRYLARHPNGLNKADVQSLLERSSKPE